MLKANDLKNVSLSNFCHYIYLEGILVGFTNSVGDLKSGKNADIAVTF